MLETLDKRTRILEAAAYCFDKYSIRRTTMDDIALKSRLSRPTIYREFRSKDEIVECVSVNKSREITRLVQKAIQGVETSHDKIVTAIITCVTFLSTDRQAMEVLDGDFRLLLWRSSSADVVATVTERWVPILTTAMQDGTLRPDLDLHDTIIWLTDIQIFLAARLLSHHVTPEKTRGEIERYILEGLGSRP
jgi:AcrR family transcriptional regulator